MPQIVVWGWGTICGMPEERCVTGRGEPWTLRGGYLRGYLPPRGMNIVSSEPSHFSRAPRIAS